MVARRVAEVFPPGEFIREELEAREWTQADLAEIMGKSQRLISEVISGKRGITPETAQGLGLAFGTSAQYWMNLDSSYQLSKVEDQGNEIERRARLFQLFPVKDMVKRGWIEPSQNVDVLDARFKQFFEVQDLEERPSFLSYAAKMADTAANDSPGLNAWLFRTRQLAHELTVGAFSEMGLEEAIVEMRSWMAEVENIGRVPERLAQAGVRLVIVEAFPGMKVDGVCYWLDKDEPVVALTTRMDRVDNFWFVLMHELRHVANRDTLAIDENLGPGTTEDVSAEFPDFEIRANREAAEAILSREQLREFIRSTAPVFSATRVEAFAANHGLHPGILVGQLHHMKAIPYSYHRRHLVKIREMLVRSAKTDGWGFPAAAE